MQVDKEYKKRLNSWVMYASINAMKDISKLKDITYREDGFGLQEQRAPEDCNISEVL